MKFTVKVKPDAGAFNCLRNYEKTIELVEATEEYEIYEITVEQDISTLLDQEAGVVEYELEE